MVSSLSLRGRYPTTLDKGPKRCPFGHLITFESEGFKGAGTINEATRWSKRGPVLTPPATSPRYKAGKALSANRPWGPIYFTSTRTRIEKSRPRPSSSLRECAGPRGSAASAAHENWPPFDDASRKPALNRID